MLLHRGLTAFLVLLLLVATFVAIPHCHDNTIDHHDCPICLVSHYQQATSQSTIAFDGIPFITKSTYALYTTDYVEQIVISFLKNRAPPA
jgi:hypothetical protein